MPKHLTERDLTVSSTIPTEPYNGQVWMDNESGKIKKYESGSWIDYNYADANVVNNTLESMGLVIEEHSTELDKSLRGDKYDDHKIEIQYPNLDIEVKNVKSNIKTIEAEQEKLSASLDNIAKVVEDENTLVVGGEKLKLGGKSESNVTPIADVSFKKDFAVTGQKGEITFKSNGDIANRYSCNVLSIQHERERGSSAIRFLRYQDGAEIGAVGYQNYNAETGPTSWYADGCVFLAASQPLYENGVTQDEPPSKLILAQEGSYNGVFKSGARFQCNEDWTMQFLSPQKANIMKLNNNETVEVGTTGLAPQSLKHNQLSLYCNTKDDAGMLIRNDNRGIVGNAQITLQAGDTLGNITTFPTTWTFGDFPKGGIAMHTEGAGGIALIAQHEMTEIKFLIGGYTGANEAMRIDYQKNVGIGTRDPKSKLHVVGLPVYNNNESAIAGGLTAGAFYRTNANPSVVCVVY